MVTGTTQGSTLRRATYAASAWSTGLDYGASYGCTSDDPALIVTRATEAAKFGEGASGWSGYSLLTNNCETFAYWCSTGRRVMALLWGHENPTNSACRGGGRGAGGRYQLVPQCIVRHDTHESIDPLIVFSVDHAGTIGGVRNDFVLPPTHLSARSRSLAPLT